VLKCAIVLNDLFNQTTLDFLEDLVSLVCYEHVANALVGEIIGDVAVQVMVSAINNSGGSLPNTFCSHSSMSFVSMSLNI
jgi:hypothetical protein